MILGFRSKALRRYWERNDTSGIRPDWRRRVALVLSALDAATGPGELNVPGLGYHPLTGDLAGRHAVAVSRNWRITFSWVGEDATEVDMEDYHG